MTKGRHTSITIELTKETSMRTKVEAITRQEKNNERKIGKRPKQLVQIDHAFW